ncbi:MAG: pantetheine-phosphate adenylyltransferase [archaeon]
MVKAMYGFSADPITYGHINIVERAAKMYEHLTVAIGVNPDKNYMFSLDERTDMANKALAHLNNVKVDSFKGLLVDYAYEQNIEVVVKGIRNSTDADYEQLLDDVGKSQRKGIDTVTLYALPDLAKVSSSMVKNVLKEQGLIHKFVPLHVKQALESKMLGQYVVGVTGGIGCGKSYVSKKFVELGKDIPVYDIDLDKIGHQILDELTEPRYVMTRAEVVNEFGINIRYENGFINRKALGEIVFNDTKALSKLNKIMGEPLLTRLRREMTAKKGLILLDAALIAESGISYLCNNNVVMVYADKKTQLDRLKQRRNYDGKTLTDKQIERRISSQFNFEQKKSLLEEAIEKENHGKILVVDNSESVDTSKNILDAFNEVVEGI